MTNLDRLLLEINGINLEYPELCIYLDENGLAPDGDYLTTSTANKRAILQTALSILESLANDPIRMQDQKMPDFSITDFAANLQNRIDQLERKIRQMPRDDRQNSSYFVLFNK